MAISFQFKSKEIDAVFLFLLRDLFIIDNKALKMLTRNTYKNTKYTLENKFDS